MRLLHKKTLQFEEFIGDDAPSYGILSHTWGKDEITFVDMVRYNEGDEEQRARVEKKLGWKKIRFMQNITRDVKEINHFWVDTCAIDKSSSAELSEAINSMFRWYRRAHACYAYLTDILSPDLTGHGAFEFKHAKWFTRGWTLQELIAPNTVLFFNIQGKEIGTRKSLCTLLSEITGIDEDILMGLGRLSDVSIARRMSWAAARETTRVEDRAYSLLGIFDVNLALIYGEGEKAFFRLQEEIMKETYDQSIFAWTLGPLEIDQDDHHRAISVLARNPSYFGRSRDVVRRSGELDSHAMTNKGVKIRLPIIRTPDGTIAAILCCTSLAQSAEAEGIQPYSLAIVLQSTAKGDGSFGRKLGKVNIMLSIPDALREHAEYHKLYLSKLDDPLWLGGNGTGQSYGNTGSSQSRIPRYNRFRLKFTAPGYCNWVPHRFITAPKPLGPLTTFETVTDYKHMCDLFADGIWFLPTGPDGVIAIQYAHVVRSLTGFVIILESRNQFRTWDLSVYRCGRDDNMETMLLEKTGGRSAPGDFHWDDTATVDKATYRKRLDDSMWVIVGFDYGSKWSADWSRLSVRLSGTGRKKELENVFELAG
jgi:hypothetical protein